MSNANLNDLIHGIESTPEKRIITYITNGDFEEILSHLKRSSSFKHLIDQEPPHDIVVEMKFDGNRIYYKFSNIDTLFLDDFTKPFDIHLKKMYEDGSIRTEHLITYEPLGRSGWIAL